MINIFNLILQFGFSPKYTTHPFFSDTFTAMIIAALIAIALNFAFSLLRKKTTDIEKMGAIMKETNDWRKKYMAAVKKQDKVQIDELKKKQVLCQQNEYGDPTTANEAYANIYDTIIYSLDFGISCCVWTNCCNLTNRNTVDNVQRR